MIKLHYTHQAVPKLTEGALLHPVNVCSVGVVCTLNTRYNDMALPKDILSLAHFPKTVVLIEYLNEEDTDSHQPA